MAEFRLNLIRAAVPSARQRRLRYRGMVLYLALAGAALAGAIGASTSWLTRAAAAQDEIDHLERRFAANHPEQQGIVRYTASLEQAMTAQLAVLASLDRALASRPRPARLIYHLVLSLPPDVTLRNLTIAATEETVTIELLVPSARAESGLGPSDLITLWNQDAALRGYMNRVAYVGSQREASGERNDIVWRFTGRLARGE